MKTIDKIRVTVTYQVGIGGVSVPEKVLNQLKEAYDNGEEIDGTSTDFGEASEWLADNIKEKDCFEISYEIDELR